MAKAENISLRDLADAMAESLGISKAASYDALGGVFESIAKNAMGGAKVSLFQFGTFSCKERKARTGRNPQTGAAIKIAASKSLGFKASSAQKAKGGKKK